MLLMWKRNDYTKLSLVAALLSGTIFAQLAAAQTVERLPKAAYSTAQLERLPRTDDDPPANGTRLNPRGVVRFSGGSIELKVPDGWWAEEVPFGREVRLVIAPQRAASVRKMPFDGMWMAYHALAPTELRGDDALSRELSVRLRAASKNNGQFSSPTRFQLGQWPAMVAEFTAGESSLATTPITGRHVLVRTEWGVFEFHASAPDAIVESRSGIWTATWESLRLNPPNAANGSPHSGTSKPNSIIGSWKSYRSQMRFGDDGRVVIIPDSAGNNRSASPLTGTFDARDDLVFVRWDDGSRLNFRWRMEGNDLYLTDHEGQISHLKRVFN